MQADFWHQRWRQNKIGFHQDNPHDLLTRHWPKVSTGTTASVFVPLCGKSNDLQWLRAQGHTVVGVELSKIAIDEFIETIDGDFTHTTAGKLNQYVGNGFCLYQGDFFDLRKEHLMDASLIYDRAALVALPPKMRITYTEHLRTLISRGARKLLISLKYDQSKREGPPFAVPALEIESLYGNWCEITMLEQITTEESSGPLAELDSSEAGYQLIVK